MAHIVTGSANLRYDRLGIIPLGGQSELGQVLWIFCYGGEILLIDAGVAYPADDLPGVDLLLPNTNFLEANQERICALVLTNGHEEHCGAVSYLLNHIKIPRILAPRFVSSLLAQASLAEGTLSSSKYSVVVDTVEVRHPYQIGPFEVEWITVNNAIADACALSISTPEGRVVYTSSFKLDQTPVDKRFMDVARLAKIGDEGVSLLISDSTNAEEGGYTLSEQSIVPALDKQLSRAKGRVFFLMPGTNTHRLQILFDAAKRHKRKVVLVGEVLIGTAVTAAITGNLVYDRTIEASVEQLNDLPDQQCLVIATGKDGDPMDVMSALSYRTHADVNVKDGDTLIFSADVIPGYARRMAMMLDELLAQGVHAVSGARAGLHVSKHGSREELKLMLSIVKPNYFCPAIGEERHLVHHAQLAQEWGLPFDATFPIKNGDVLELSKGNAQVIGSIEAQAVLFNRDQGERVTTFSVNERRALSLEGVVTVSLVVAKNGAIASGPDIEVSASGFRESKEWQTVKGELANNISEVVQKLVSDGFYGAGDHGETGALKAAVRECTSKTLRSRLQAKPTVQVVIHELGVPSRR